MNDGRGGSPSRRLRAAGEGPVADAAALERAVGDCLAAAPGGIPARSLAAAVADHMGVAVSAVSPRALNVALGVLIATGRLDEVGGRLVAVGREHRQAG